MNLTDTELTALLDDLESDRVERKESFRGDASEKVRQAVCAFANDLPDSRSPGIVFIGARDDGSPTGLAVTDELLLKLADIRSDGNIQPLPTMTVQKRVLKGAEMAVIAVQPADAPPVDYKGRIYIRTGPRRDIATRQDIRILSERRRHRDLPFDIQPVSFTAIADLNRLVFETEYLPSAFAPEVLAANQRSYEEQLTALRMVEAVERPVPTVLGCIVLGNRPRDLIPANYVQFIRFDGTDLADVIQDAETIDGRLSDLLRRLDDKLEAHIRQSVNITGAATETRRPTYPLAALQQLVRNAVMHRTYEATNAPIRVNWFTDRIEILNPGGAFGMVTRDNFGAPGVTDYRNPNLAQAMKVLGYVQRFGVGIALARRLLADNGNPPPVFEVRDTHVLVTVREAV